MQNRISSVITLPFIQAFIHCFGQHDEIVEFTLRWGIPRPVYPVLVTQLFVIHATFASTIMIAFILK